MRLIVLGVLVASFTQLAGCAAEQDTRQFQARRIDADADAVLAAAEVALRREFGPLSVDRGSRRIEIVPQEYTTARESGTSRDLVGVPSNLRRLAQCSVTPRGDRSILRLRIEVQRQDAAQREALRTDTARISDTPAYTPIDRDAAVTREQNAVWTFVRRDRALESALLAEVQDRFAAEPPEPSPGSAPVAESPAP